MSNMEETIKKEIQKCELADVFIDAFLSPQHATRAFISALQARQVPNVADLFNSKQIEAAAAITKKVSVLINLQTFAPTCAFRFWRISSAKRKQNASPKSKSANASFSLHFMALSPLSPWATNDRIIRSLKIGDKSRQAKICVEVVFMLNLISACCFVAGAPQNWNWTAFDVQLDQQRITIALYDENWKQKKSEHEARRVRRDAGHRFERRTLRADCARLRLILAPQN